MKKAKEIYGSGYYIFESRATGNSNYIESISEAKRLLTYFNYYLKDYLKIHDYQITRYGFQIAVKIHSKDRIFKNKAGLKKDSETVWRIISEQVRLAIGTYVRFANRRRGRKGTLVQESYNRYFFECVAEVEAFISKIRSQQMKSLQRKKYRGLKTHYKISNRISSGSIFLCSKELKRGSFRKKFGGEIKVIKGLDDLVVLDIVKFTKKLHFPKKNLKPSYLNLLI